MQINFSVTVPEGVVFAFAPNGNMPPYFNDQPYPPTSIGTDSGGYGPPYTFVASSGLPAGMILSVDGILSGTPTGASGNLTIVGVTKDANG